MGLFEKQSLAISAGHINRAGVNEQNITVMERNIYSKNMQEYFCMEEVSSFSCERR